MTEEKKYPHEGHRDRVKQRFLNVGLEDMTDNEILEMVLFYAIPRKDTNDIAKKLLDHFGTLFDFFEAPADELQNCGLSVNTAVYIKMIAALFERYYSDKIKNDIKAITGTNTTDKISHLFKDNDCEKVAVMLTDSFGRELHSCIIYDGTVSNTDIYFKKITELILKYHAWGIIIAHNHPDGVPVPSADDVTATRKLKSKFFSMNIKLLDHIIFSESGSVSMASLEEFHDIFFI